MHYTLLDDCRALPLGHGSLTTTEVYTRVTIRALKEVHDATHPSAKMRRRVKAAKEEQAVGGRLAIVFDDEEEDDASYS